MKFCNEDFMFNEEDYSCNNKIVPLRKGDTFDDLGTFLHYFENERTHHEDQDIEQSVAEEENTLTISFVDGYWYYIY